MQPPCKIYNHTRPSTILNHLPLIFSLLLLLPPSLSEVTISVSPKTLTKSGDTFRIQLSSVQPPSKLDWLSLYSPLNSLYDDFISYKFPSSSSLSQFGLGSILMPLIDLQSNYSFQIFRWMEYVVNHKCHDHDHNSLPRTAHLLAKSKEVGFVDLDQQAEQIHLAYTESEDEMQAMLMTEDREEGGRPREVINFSIVLLPTNI